VAGADVAGAVVDPAGADVDPPAGRSPVRSGTVQVIQLAGTNPALLAPSVCMMLVLIPDCAFKNLLTNAATSPFWEEGIEQCA